MTSSSLSRLRRAGSPLVVTTLLLSGCGAAREATDPAPSRSASSSPSRPSDPSNADRDLRAAVDVVLRALRDHHDQTGAFPRRVRLDGDALSLTGRGRATQVRDDTIRPTVRLDWYVDRRDPRQGSSFMDGVVDSGDRYTYCLSASGRHATGSGDADGGAAARYDAGGCPTPPR